jgi:hypothetical protein
VTPGTVIDRTAGTATGYNCSTNGNAVITVSSSVRLSESVTFSHANLDVNIGLNLAVVAGGKLSLPLDATTNQTTHVQVLISGQQDLPRCEGIGIEAQYKVVNKRATEIIYRNIIYYTWCDCYLDMGGGNIAMLNNVDVTYMCNPETVRAESSLLGGTGNASDPQTLVTSAFFTPPRAPSSSSPSQCADCPAGGSGGGDDDDDDPDDTGPTGDPLVDDPHGDADGDGIPNWQDDTPYGYDGDDPFGDDDGDGIPNWKDPTPYGDHGPGFKLIPTNFDVFLLPQFWIS